MYQHYTEEMRMMSFSEIIRDIIDSRLDRHKGETIRISDLPGLLIKEDEAEERMFTDENDARAFIEDHPVEEEAAIRNFISEKSLAKQNDPGYFTYLMEVYGIEKLFDSSHFMYDLDQEEITLTPDVIDQIRQDLDIEIEQPQRHEIFYGYVYDDNGMHGDPILFEADPENISMFIMNNQFNQTVVTDSMDSFVVSSLPGGFLDRVCNDETRQQILEHLLPYQQGEKFPMTFPAEESFIQIGDKIVNIQFNSDKDFDYTIYNKDLSELDGGIIDNTHHLDSIPGSVYEAIRDMHHLE